MRHIFIFLLATSLSLQAFAQNNYFKNYTPLQPKGEIPKVVIQSFEEKVEAAMTEEIKKEDKSRTKKNKKNFLVSSNYSINEFLQGGSILFNDTLTTYVSNVAKELLKDDPELFSKLTFFVVKSPYVNAFTTNDGLVFVNMGLLAQLETEAQLAYILAHEIIHFKRKHVINIYLENSDITSVYKRNKYSDEEYILKKSNFSKETELEADEQGLDLFLNSNYSFKSLNKVFDVLQFSYLPIDEIPFDSLYFDNEYLKLPQSYFLKKVKDIQIHEEENSTHPNISVRREKVLTRIKDREVGSKKEFYRSKEEFQFVRNVARFELSALFLKKKKYASAIYNSYVMLKDFPGNPYLTKNIAMSLYFLAKYNNQEARDKIFYADEDIEGEIQQVYHMLNQFGADELNTLACQYVWNTYYKFPQDESMKKRGEELLNELIYIHHHDRDYFSELPAKKVGVEVKKDLPKEEKIEEGSKSKYDKIREKMTEEKVVSVDTNKFVLRFAFVGLFQKEEFKKAFNRSIENYVNKKSKEEVKTSYDDYSIQKRKNLKIGNFGIDKLIIIDPAYLKLKNSKDQEIKLNHYESAKKERELNQLVLDIADQAKLDITLLSPTQFETHSIDKYVELYRLNESMDEIYANSKLDSFVTIDATLPQYLLEKYNTTYFAANLFINYQEPRSKDVLVWCLYPFFWPALPVAFVYTMFPNRYMFHSISMVDVSKGNICLQNFYVMKGLNAEAQVKSNLYYNFLHIKSAKKAKKELE